MKLLINPKITLCKAIKGVQCEITVVLSKKDLNELTIRSISFNRKDKRIVGRITRNGSVKISLTKQAKPVYKYMTNQTKDKIEFLLDMVFGTKRDKFPVINKKGYTEFK